MTNKVERFFFKNSGPTEPDLLLALIDKHELRLLSLRLSRGPKPQRINLKSSLCADIPGPLDICYGHLPTFIVCLTL